MTPSSPLIRLEKLAEKESWRYLVSIPAQRRDIERACVNVGKALLQILSEPGEACGPRAWLDYDEEHLSYLPLHGSTEYCDLRELTQGRAALASSEARVRILSEAVEVIASRHKPRHETEEYWQKVSHEQCATVLATDTKIARQALQEVQR